MKVVPILGFFLLCLAAVSYADDALVLPKGIFRATLENDAYLPVDTRYDPNGKVEDIAADFNANLDSTIFPALALLDPFVPGLASIGESDVSFKYNFNIMKFSFQYGLTDSLTVGVRIPYWWVKNKVDARVNSGPGSSANVGKNPFFACGSPVCPLFVPGTSRFTTEDVQDLLGQGLDVNGDGVIDIPGFKYKRFQSWEGKGLSDIEAGLRYQYFNSRLWRLAFTSGVRFPSGRVDDPDNLTDYPFSSGAYQLLFRFNHDFVISNLWKNQPKSEPMAGSPGAEPGDVVLNATFRYDLVLPDKQKKRVLLDVNNPLTRNKEKVSRDLGDGFEFETSAKYTFLKGVTFSGLYKYGFKLKDRISGNQGLSYSSLEEETRADEQVYILELSYSTIPLYLEKKFPLPFTTSFSYRNRFAGSNNVLRSQYFAFGLEFLF